MLAPLRLQSPWEIRLDPDAKPELAKESVQPLDFSGRDTDARRLTVVDQLSGSLRADAQCDADCGDNSQAIAPLRESPDGIRSPIEARLVQVSGNGPDVLTVEAADTGARIILLEPAEPSSAKWATELWQVPGVHAFTSAG
jgi:hypothetical protein